MVYYLHMQTWRLELIKLLPHLPRSPRMRIVTAGFILAALGALAAFVPPLVIVAVAAAIFFFIATLVRPRWTLTFVALWMPLEPFFLKFVPDALYLSARYFSETIIYFFAIVVLLKLGLGEKRWKATPIDVPFVLFMLVLAASAIINFIPLPIAVLGIRQIIRFIVLFFAVVALYPPRDYIRKLTVALFILVMLQSALGIAQAFAGGALDSFLLPTERKFFDTIQLTSGAPQFWDPGTRVFATLGRYDVLGTFLVFFILLAIGFLYESALWKDRRELGLLLALGIPALILTYSRSAWFGFFLGFLLIGLVFMRDRRIWIGIGMFVALIAGYLLYSGVVVPQLIEQQGVRQTVAERFLESFSAERWRSEYYGLGRLYYLVTTPRLVVAASPLFGWGPGQYGGGAAAALHNTRVYDALGIPFGIYGTEGHIDNNWFSLWGEAGTIGLALYLWIFGALFFAARRVWRFSADPITRSLALGFMGALLAFSFNAFLGTMLEVRTLALYFWLYAAFVVVLGRREKII